METIFHKGRLSTGMRHHLCTPRSHCRNKSLQGLLSHSVLQACPKFGLSLLTRPLCASRVITDKLSVITDGSMVGNRRAISESGFEATPPLLMASRCWSCKLSQCYSRSCVRSAVEVHENCKMACNEWYWRGHFNTGLQSKATCAQRARVAFTTTVTVV